MFNKVHRLDLDFLKPMSRKAAEGFVESLDGVGAHAKAMVMLRCLGTPVVPVDDYMLSYLRREGCVPETATAEEAQKLLTNRIADRDMAAFYAGLKKHAATHAPRKPEKPAPARAEPAKSAPMASAKATAVASAKAAAVASMKAMAAKREGNKTLVRSGTAKPVKRTPAKSSGARGKGKR